MPFILIVFFNALSCLQIDKIIVSALQQEVFSFLLGIIFNKTMYIGIRVSIRVVGDCCAFILLRRLQVSPLTVVFRFSVLVVLTHYYSTTTTIHNGLKSNLRKVHASNFVERNPLISEEWTFLTMTMQLDSSKKVASCCFWFWQTIYSINWLLYIIFYCRIAHIFGHHNGLIKALRNSFSSRHSDSGTKLASSMSAIPIGEKQNI